MTRQHNRPRLNINTEINFDNLKAFLWFGYSPTLSAECWSVYNLLGLRIQEGGFAYRCCQPYTTPTWNINHAIWALIINFCLLSAWQFLFELDHSDGEDALLLVACLISCLVHYQVLSQVEFLARQRTRNHMLYLHIVCKSWLLPEYSLGFLKMKTVQELCYLFLINTWPGSRKTDLDWGQ